MEKRCKKRKGKEKSGIEAIGKRKWKGRKKIIGKKGNEKKG